ncbi:hypothetical protein L3Y34_017732 [Caenorhabditis briggsae]|uniref:Uncharacterized protein n=1 Tax=Caenorhabditis briggsae TaxID=6238 RepID=A0AAE9DK29_CAEBR|nr:hypothetical protein L3Y34_017732 [Caenorhabditis briggsae]
MSSADHLGNLFSDEEDSFDDPVPGLKPPEEEDNESLEDDSDEVITQQPLRDLDLAEEDFNLLTIENVPLNVLKLRIGRVIAEVLYRGEPAAMALFDVANKIVFQSTMMDAKRNAVIETIICGLTRMIFDNRERAERVDQAENVLMLFVAKLSIKNKSIKCSDLFFQLILLIDRLFLHVDSNVRSRVNLLIAYLVEEANRYSEIMREHGDNVFLFTDENPTEEEEMIPNGVRKRWVMKLAKSLLDKSPQVRCKAVVALSLWDHDIVIKSTNGEELTVNDLIWKSVHDVDESVRISAARRVHIVDEKEINKCIDYVERSKDTRVRQEIINRLASDVHLFSYSDEQRYRLVNLLNDSDNARVQDVIHQRLVESWMKVAGEEIISPSVFPPSQPNHEIPNEFPSIILQYLDPFVDPDAVYIFLKFAIIRFTNKVSGKASDHIDVEEFMKACLKIPSEDSECIGLMRRTTFRLVSEDTENSIEELNITFLRIFVTRCCLDVVFDSVKGRLDAEHLRNRALMFFLPDVTTFVEELRHLCFTHFKEDADDRRELLLYNIIHLINKSVKYGNVSDDRITYKNVLMELLASPTLQFSNPSVSTMVTTCIDLCKNGEETEDICNWFCETASQLMMYESEQFDRENPKLETAMENDTVLDRMYLRGATMLLATCKHEEIETPTSSMTSLFKSIIPALLGNENKGIQKIGLELIGYATSIDFVNCEPYIKLTQLLIHRDDEVLKSTGLHTLARVIKRHGFPKTAQAIFQEQHQSEEECQNELAKLFETSLVTLRGMVLVQTVQDYLSMLSYGRFAWPKLHCALLLIIFQNRNSDLPLVKIFKSYCKKAIRSDFTRMNLMLGFVRSIDIISKSSEHDANLNIMEMTEQVCEAISCVPTIGDENDELLKQNEKKEKHLEVELANKMVSRAVAFPSAWFIRHVFTAMSTSLRLEGVPMDKLDDLHNRLVDSYTEVRFNSGKTTQIAFKRFLTQCEKVISLHESMKALKSGIALKKVKTEPIDGSSVVGSSSSSSVGKRKKEKKHAWDEDELKEDPDDSFEYFPKSTRTRKRQITSNETVLFKKTKMLSDEEGEEKEAIHIDDSFEL